MFGAYVKRLSILSCGNLFETSVSLVCKFFKMKKGLLFVFITGAILSQAQPPDSVQNERLPQAQVDTIPEPETPRIIYYKGGQRERERRREDIKTISGRMSHSGGFGALSLRSTQFRDETMVFAGLRGGWIINRTLAIGLEGHGIIPTAKYDDIDATDEVTVLGGYGGMFLELIFFSNEVVHVTFPVSGGAGWVGYNTNLGGNSSGGDNLIDEDVFWYVEPGAGLEVNLSRNFRLALGVSQRFTQDLELLETSEDALGKLNYYITLKVGSF
jgi:hypothetical protein